MQKIPAWTVRALILAMFVSLLAPLAPSTSGAPHYQFVMRVYFADAGARTYLLKTLDVLEPAVHPEGYVVAYGDESDLAALRAAGYRAEIDTHLTDELFNPHPDTFNGGYRTVEELYADMDAAVAAHPGIAEIVDAGDSWCKTQGGCTLPDSSVVTGYDLKAVHITNRAITGTKPVSFWVAAHHAREIHTPEIAMRYVDWLLDNYNVNADATWLVDYHDIWVIPLGNPDAHKLVEMGGNLPWWQRKNLDVSASAPWSQCGYPPSPYAQSGVDLNRNHDFHWRGSYGGWGSDPCEQTYPGALANGPASEPEVQGYTQLASSVLIDQRGPGDEDAAPITTTGIFVSIHSGTEWILIPYDWRPGAAPNDADLQAVWDKVDTWTPGWPSCQTGQCYGSYVAGSASDWAYGTFGVPATVWEIGDFMPDYSLIDSYYWPFLRPMMIYTTRIARTPYLDARGPDALNVSSAPISGTLPETSVPVRVTATINDTQNGNQPIAAAFAYVDTPPWAGGTPIALSAVDGTFDETIEDVSGVFNMDAASLFQRHTIWVRGQDAGGHVGPPFAAFLTWDGAQRMPVDLLPMIVR